MEFTQMRVPLSLCPQCGQKLDGASTPDGPDLPDPGDVSVCIYCSSILVFDAELKLALPSPAMLDEILAEDPRLVTFVQAATEVRKTWTDPVESP
jgi:hypothetical protein